jgi:hypothetical protein
MAFWLNTVLMGVCWCAFVRQYVVVSVCQVWQWIAVWFEDTEANIPSDKGLIASNYMTVNVLQHTHCCCCICCLYRIFYLTPFHCSCFALYFELSILVELKELFCVCVCIWRDSCSNLGSETAHPDWSCGIWPWCLPSISVPFHHSPCVCSQMNVCQHPVNLSVSIVCVDMWHRSFEVFRGKLINCLSSKISKSQYAIEFQCCILVFTYLIHFYHYFIM